MASVDEKLHILIFVPYFIILIFQLIVMFLEAGAGRIKKWVFSQFKAILKEYKNTILKIWLQLLHFKLLFLEWIETFLTIGDTSVNSSSNKVAVMCNIISYDKKKEHQRTHYSRYWRGWNVRCVYHQVCSRRMRLFCVEACHGSDMLSL